MTVYESNRHVRPIGEEAAEFLETAGAGIGVPETLREDADATRPDEQADDDLMGDPGPGVTATTAPGRYARG